MVVFEISCSCSDLNVEDSILSSHWNVEEERRNKFECWRTYCSWSSWISISVTKLSVQILVRRPSYDCSDLDVEKRT